MLISYIEKRIFKKIYNVLLSDKFKILFFSILAFCIQLGTLVHLTLKSYSNMAAIFFMQADSNAETESCATVTNFRHPRIMEFYDKYAV